MGDDRPLEKITRKDICSFMNGLDGVCAKALVNYHVGLSPLWTWTFQEGHCQLGVLPTVT